MGWGGIASGIGSLLGGVAQGEGAKSAANSQADATRAGIDLQQHEYDQTRTDNLPLLGARNDALARLEKLLGLSGGPGGIDSAEVMKDPGYEFGLQQGQHQLSNSFNARGMRDSGAALKAATQYGTDYATTKYDAALNRQLNPLQSVAGLGQSGANTIAAAGQNAANNETNLTSGLGNALAASQIAQGNIWANTGNQLAGWYQNYSRANNGAGSPGVSYGGYGSTLYGDGYGPQ